MAKYSEVTLGQVEALIKKMGGLKNFHAFLRGEFDLIPVTDVAQKLLEFLGTVTIPGTTTKFVARDNFVENKNSSASVKISCVCDDFTTWFLSGSGKIEAPREECSLRFATLRKIATSTEIIVALGGKEKSETMLVSVFSLMEKQVDGQEGVLLTNGLKNIFYVHDRRGKFREVSVAWYGDGWYIYANEASDPYWLPAGNRVFSCN